MNKMLKAEVASIEHCLEVLKDCDKHCSTATMMVTSIKNSCTVLNALSDKKELNINQLNKKIKRVEDLKNEYSRLHALKNAIERHNEEVPQPYHSNIVKRMNTIVSELNSLIQ